MKNNTIIHSQKESKDNKFLAYKFRPIRTFCDLCREVDFLRIEEILDGKLYCADWRKLNDVLEGKYTYCDSNNTTEQLLFDMGNRLQNQKEAYRVCSLTKNSTDPLMWAFYASDNAGVAIEIELEKNDNIFSVVYENTIPKIELGSLCIDESDVDGSKTRAIAKHILTHKIKAWAHEKEVRIIVENDKYYTIKKPKRLYFGPRMKRAEYNKLQVICNSRDIKMISIAEVDPAQFGKHYDFNEKELVDA